MFIVDRFRATPYLHVLRHPFPPRRSSALRPARVAMEPPHQCRGADVRAWTRARRDRGRRQGRQQPWRFPRSEEHTSELQSIMRISDAVFGLKKKKWKSTVSTQKSRRSIRDDTNRRTTNT